jgi:type III pantothenate kinase
MLLAIDVGNTHTVFGIYDGARLVAEYRVSSATARTEDELGLIVKLFCTNSGIVADQVDGVGISSVVPNFTDVAAKMAQKYFHVEPLVVSAALDLGIRVLYDDPAMVGADRLCNTLAGFTKHGGPLIIIDFGTATTYDVVSRQGDYVGGVIAPGIETAAADLHRRAAKLPKIELQFPRKVVGTDTITSMQSGILYGAIDAMEGMIGRIKEIVGEDTKVIATGGFSKLIKDHSHIVDYWEPELVLEGVRIVYDRTRR